VANLPSGQPTMRLTGGAARRLAEMTPPGHVPHVHVSLTDDYPLALSFVIISAELDPMEPGRGRPPREAEK
jgi:holo-[acyl-carrier protein] synthase